MLDQFYINNTYTDTRITNCTYFIILWGINTFKIWQEEGAEQLKAKADKNWIKIKKEK